MNLSRQKSIISPHSKSNKHAISKPKPWLIINNISKEITFSLWIKCSMGGPVIQRISMIERTYIPSFALFPNFR